MLLSLLCNRVLPESPAPRGTIQINEVVIARVWTDARAIVRHTGANDELRLAPFPIFANEMVIDNRVIEMSD